MFSRGKRGKLGERRVSPPVYRFLLAAHVVVSVGWLGVVFAKLVLGLAAATAGSQEASGAMYASMEVLNATFPPAAVGTALTGGLLSLGTRWGLLKHYWVLAKIVLTVGVITTGIGFVNGLIQRSISGPVGQATVGFTVFGTAWAPAALISLSASHVLMLGVATVVSVYKPWGKTGLGRGGKRT